MHKKSSFPLRIFSLNVTKSQFAADLVTFTEEIFNGKLHFWSSEQLSLEALHKSREKDFNSHFI